MESRRSFMQKAVGVTVAAALVSADSSADTGSAAARKVSDTSPLQREATGRRVKSLIRRDDTIRRLGGDCYVSGITWTDDNRQLVALIDSAGWPEVPKAHYYNTRLFTVSGTPQQAGFADLARYPEILTWDYERGAAPYYGMNVLAVGEHIYQYLTTENYNYSVTDSSSRGDFSWVNAKLIYSPDNGRTWCNADGSTPVMKEPKQQQSQKNMAFFHEPQDAFAFLSFLQMGKGYRENRDGYVYVYAPNGTREGTMNELVMFRVPKAEIPNRRAYEFFAGRKGDGTATWVKDVAGRAVVHTFPAGWVADFWPFAWLPSVAYNAALGVYMMVNCSGTRGDCVAPKPTYLGVWVAAEPWGPWLQIHEETSWTPGGKSDVRATAPQIAPQWISEDGRSFWLVWTEVQQQGTQEDVTTPIYYAHNEVEFNAMRRKWREHKPYYAFNAQRIDLVVT